MTKTCIKCGRTDQETPFLNNLKNRKPHCKECEKERMRLYRAKDRLLALQAYGGEHPKCSCPGCKEDRLPFLSIDHTNGGGKEHRRQLRLAQDPTDTKRPLSPGGGVVFRWLRKMGYPPGYRVLCYNCNQARSAGPCPVHEISKFVDPPTIKEIRQDLLRKLVDGVKSGRIVLS